MNGGAAVGSTPHRSSAASAVRPGPNASATHGRGASRRRNRSSRNSTVAELMLPHSDSTARASSSAPRGSSSACSTAPSTRGPPGCTAHEPTRATSSPFFSSQRSSHGRRLPRTRSGTSAPSPIAKPWSPISQRIASGPPGSSVEPLAHAVHGPSPALATSAAAPSANSPFATMLSGSAR
jgi:hypothetical protein